MSFFYGINATTPTNSSSMSPLDKPILPGHNFRDPYMTTTIAVIGFTIVWLFAIALMISRVPAIGEPQEPDSTTTKEHPSSGSGAICFYYMMLVLRAFSLVDGVSVLISAIDISYSSSLHASASNYASPCPTPSSPLKFPAASSSCLPIWHSSPVFISTRK